MLIKSMCGFGDSIYIRAFMHAYKGSYIETPFPELYDDLGLFGIKPIVKLRTQAKHVAKSNYPWHCSGYAGSVISINYGINELRQGSIIDTMRRVFNTEPVYSLPDCGESPIVSDKPIAVVRPSTLRREWLNPARAPLPEYIEQAAKILKGRGFHVVVVADIDGVNEWLDGQLPVADEYFIKGELSFIQLLALIKSAKIVVGGVGWIVPACVASGTAGYFILGGNGMHNAPEKITKSSMDLSKIGWAKPDNFCMCPHKVHNCDKTITNFEAGFNEWLDKTV